MHSDPAEIKKSIRTYMMVGAVLYVGTIITVAVNQVHLVVPLAVTVALIIATVKGSLVASVFMHLSHEKKWIYGALLLTVAFLHRADVRPVLHRVGHDRLAEPVADAGARRARDGALTCR